MDRFLAVGWFLQGASTLDALFDGAEIVRGFSGRWRSDLTGVLAWGRKPSARRAAAFAAKRGLRVIHAEDGFLRSYGTGDRFPPLCVTVDDQGIYYDSTRPSALESLLNSPKDVLAGLHVDVARARALILGHRLSKYNHAPMLDPAVLRAGDVQRVLVIDQTAGDLSVRYGGADAATFDEMLQAALAENPSATVYVKTHPEVVSGRKGGYLTKVQDGERVVVLRGFVNPISLIEQMDRVYVVTSTMGFEALLAGKPVSCFGMPWYAGWGITDDRQRCARRTRSRTIDEVFAAAYFHHSRYLNPVTGKRGTLFDVIDWLLRQQATVARFGGRMVCVGLRRWKYTNLRPMLALNARRVLFARNAVAAAKLQPRPEDCVIAWGRDQPADLLDLVARTGCRLLRAEDGFLRSVGLGSDLVPPMSIVLDERGLYFDPGQASDLEHILATASFAEAELAEAARVRAFIVANGLTKYNVEPREQANWASAGRQVVLVPGQVEDDASIRYGCAAVSSNSALLQAARKACPDAFIVYKPHPDVMTGNRAGRLSVAQAAQWADHVETRLSVVSCIEACDAVYTMTSLTGFDALLRGKQVVTYGEPFYAGWGLTQDMAPSRAAAARRQRRLSLDELVAGVLLRYPIYWDAHLRGYANCEATLNAIVATRNALEARGALTALHVGFLRRQWRKLGLVIRSWRAGN